MAVTLDSLKKTVGKKSANSRAFAWLADLEREAGDLDKALQRVDGGLTLYPGDVSAMLVRAKILFQKEDFEACVEECGKVLVADPFNLAAQRIMGDAYDKLENIGERNRCYRRLHDMDPLNNFWKDEYDVVVGGVAAAAMAGEISDTDFSSPEGESFDMGDEFASDTSIVPADTMGSVETEQVEPQVAETPAFEAASENVEAHAESGDDPFAALAAMMPGSDDAEDSAMEDLSASLDSAMDSINNDISDQPAEELGADENISGSDVGSALSDMFGLDDDLEPEESSASTSASESEIPASIDDNAEANAASVFGAPQEPAVEDKPMSIDSAFEDIFGEDELPEEKPQEAAPAEEVPAVETPAADLAMDGLELPSEEGGLFEKSADADMNLSGEWSPSSTPAELSDEVAPQEEAPKPAEDKPVSIDSAFEDIFGEDELPEEKPQEAAPAEDVPVVEAPAAELDMGDLDLPSEEGGLFEKSADADMNLVSDIDEVPEEKAAESVEPSPAEELPALETPATETVEPVAFETLVESSPAANKDSSIDSAFENIFGDDDELPEEKPQEAAPAVDAPETVEASGSLAEQVDKAESELEMPEVKSEESDLAKEMGGAFASMFGNEDDLDLPTVNAEPAESPVNDQEATSAPVEESLEKPSEETLSNDIDKSFDNLFGTDDQVEETAEVAAPAPAAAELEPASDLDSLESEVSGAFKGLFDMEDDALAEEKPSNKGVDFLMSGDSDDEISAGLINNPNAPLDRGAHDLDDSLNTRTLAEIYFDQGLYGKALEIYKDLLVKEPENAEIAKRMAEVENLYNEKFGGNA